MRPVKDSDIDKQLFQMQRELQNAEEKKLYQQDLIEFRQPDFTVGLPRGFCETKKGEETLLFANKNRPDIVLVHSTEAAGITFRVVEQADGHQHADLGEVMNQMREALLAADRKLVFYESGQLCGDAAVVWFDYKSFAVDERVYNMIFLFNSSNKLVIGTFYCLLKNYDKWKQRVLGMLTTLKVGEESNERI